MNQVDKWFASVYEGFSIIPMCMRKPSTRVRSGPYTSLPLASYAYSTGALVFTLAETGLCVSIVAFILCNWTFPNP